MRRLVKPTGQWNHEKTPGIVDRTGMDDLRLGLPFRELGNGGCLNKYDIRTT